jgi:hypothetical protein
MNNVKKDFGGFSYFKAILAILAFITILGIGFFDFSHNSKKNAHASSYMHIDSFAGVTLFACKTYVPAYGGVYNVNLIFTKTKSTKNYYYYYESYSPIRSYHWGMPSTSNAYYAGTIASYKINAALLTNDMIYITLTDAAQQIQLGHALSITDVLGAPIKDLPAGYYKWSDIWNC